MLHRSLTLILLGFLQAISGLNVQTVPSLKRIALQSDPNRLRNDLRLSLRLNANSSLSRPAFKPADVGKRAAVVGALLTAWSLSLPFPALAAPPRDALNVEIVRPPAGLREGRVTGFTTAVKIPGIAPVFGGGRTDVEVRFNPAGSKGAKSGTSDIEVKLPGDLKGAADAALRGHVSAQLKSPDLSLSLPVLGKISIPAVNGERIDVDVSTPSPGRAVIVVTNKNIPSLPFPGKKTSNWQAVTNMGDGDCYYYNIKTGVIQSEVPKDFRTESGL